MLAPTVILSNTDYAVQSPLYAARCLIVWACSCTDINGNECIIYIAARAAIVNLGSRWVLAAVDSWAASRVCEAADDDIK